MSDVDAVWQEIRAAVTKIAKEEKVLASGLQLSVLNQPDLKASLSYLLAEKLSSPEVSTLVLYDEFRQIFNKNPDIVETVAKDLMAVKERDPACTSESEPFLYFKGFYALQTHRVAHQLWKDGRQTLASFLQSRSSSVFSVDIHPNAQIGHGVMIDHATGIVIGQTAVVGNNVSMLHAVTLGGTGVDDCARHPHVCDGVLIGAGAKILGPVTVGENAKVASAALVLDDVEFGMTVAGNPAKPVGAKRTDKSPSETMNQSFEVVAG